MSNTNNLAAGVKRTDCCWGIRLEGKQEALVAAGLAEDSWFATCNERDKRGRVCRQKEFILDGRKVETTKAATGICVVRMHYNEEQQKAAYARLEEERARQEANERRIELQWYAYSQELRRRLTARYSGVKVSAKVRLCWADDDLLVQTVSFTASFEQLESYGLTNEHMIRESNGNFTAYHHVHTEPQERLTKRSLQETRRLLKSIFAKADTKRAKTN